MVTGIFQVGVGLGAWPAAAAHRCDGCLDRSRRHPVVDTGALLVQFSGDERPALVTHK